MASSTGSTFYMQSMMSSEDFAGDFSAAADQPIPRPEQDIFVGNLGRYTQEEVLGSGSFGLVIRAIDQEAQPPVHVAIKLLPRGNFIKNFKTYVNREILHQSSLKHPFIISLREVFLTPTHLAIAMEYAKGGNLFHYVLQHKPLCRLSEAKAQWIFQQLIIGLDYCHRRGVANRDLKLENLLLDREGNTGIRPLLKICDFGFSKHEMNSSAKTSVGTPIYMAPEIIYGSNRYDAKMADLWSCGIILYAVLFGRYPFDAQDRDYARKIVNADYEVPVDVPVNPECVDLLLRILVADPAERLSIEDIKMHPWFLRDLPRGALDMNDFYLQAPPFLEQYKEGVNSLMEQAQLVGQAADPLLCLKT
ncbi:hypothetical protein CVIRNUC_007993 [Coccomyxa viridis]|uniref:Protein kinase domain-containing protein n=1 Tax=Coccomyxa viridis TaxID=1274662 RepID=A0AAV1IFM4_9CHLO|nr:hypothetical protein CVIRNUC_007993 [Coccomyxa viridis]